MNNNKKSFFTKFIDIIHYLVYSQIDFEKTVRFRDLEGVKYALTSKELRNNIDIHHMNDIGIRWACRYGYMEIVEYLLTSKELTEHANIHACNDESFKFALENKNEKLLKYLIFDINIDKTHYIEEHLKTYPNAQVEEWFKIKNLNNELKNELTSNLTRVKRSKI